MNIPNKYLNDEVNPPWEAVRKAVDQLPNEGPDSGFTLEIGDEPRFIPNFQGKSAVWPFIWQLVNSLPYRFPRRIDFIIQIFVRNIHFLCPEAVKLLIS